MIDGDDHAQSIVAQPHSLIKSLRTELELTCWLIVRIIFDTSSCCDQNA